MDAARPGRRAEPADTRGDGLRLGQPPAAALFGGHSGGGPALNDAWTWTGSNCNRLAPASSPPPRNSAGAAYDAATGQLLLAGGFDGSADVSDQWAWSGTTWTQLFPSTSVLPARSQFVMAYDPATAQTVLFGGTSAG